MHVHLMSRALKQEFSQTSCMCWICRSAQTALQALSWTSRTRGFWMADQGTPAWMSSPRSTSLGVPPKDHWLFVLPSMRAQSSRFHTHACMQMCRSHCQSEPQAVPYQNDAGRWTWDLPKGVPEVLERCCFEIRDLLFDGVLSRDAPEDW